MTVVGKRLQDLGRVKRSPLAGVECGGQMDPMIDS